MNWCLRQLPTRIADHPLAWAVCRYFPGEQPTAAGPHDEPPAELTQWAKELNASDSATPIDFGLIGRDALDGQSLCGIDRAECKPLDDRGEWVVAVGFGHGAVRAMGIGPAAAWKLAPTLAQLLDRHYGSDSKPLPAVPPAKRVPTPVERLDRARANLRAAIAARDSTAITAAVERIIDEKLAA